MGIRENEFRKLKYMNPEKILPQLRQLQIKIAQQNIDDDIKNLRTKKLKHHLEKRIAIIFSYGIAQCIKKSVFVAFAPHENLDYDAVAYYQDGNVVHYMPLQIKEVVPERLNSQTDLNNEIKKLQKKYQASTDLVVVIHYNRRGKFKISDVKIPMLGIAALWILGASVPDQSRWFIAGNMLSHPKIFEFKYPQ